MLKKCEKLTAKASHIFQKKILVNFKFSFKFIKYVSGLHICKQQKNNIVHIKHVQHLQYCSTETYIKILTLEQYLGDGHQCNGLLIILICMRPL